MSENEREELLQFIRDNTDGDLVAGLYSLAPIDQLRAAVAGMKAQLADYARMGLVDESKATAA